MQGIAMGITLCGLAAGSISIKRGLRDACKFRSKVRSKSSLRTDVRPSRRAERRSPLGRRAACTHVTSSTGS